jgi:hypothetical protein
MSKGLGKMFSLWVYEMIHLVLNSVIGGVGGAQISYWQLVSSSEALFSSRFAILNLERLETRMEKAPQEICCRQGFAH